MTSTSTLAIVAAIALLGFLAFVVALGLCIAASEADNAHDAWADDEIDTYNPRGNHDRTR
jgi:4-hydroxybenzoate polyprenyltransferase